MRIKYYLRGLGCGIIFSVIVMTVSFGNRGNKNISDAEIIQRAKQLGMVEADATGNSGETGKEIKNETENEIQKETESESDNKIPVVMDGTEEETQNNQTGKKDEVSENTGKKPGTDNKSDSDGSKNTGNKTPEKNETTKNETEKNKVDKENTNAASPANTDTTSPANTNTNTDENNKKPGETKPGKTEFVTITVKRGQVCREISEDLQKKGIVDDAEAFRVFMGQKGYASNIKCGTFKVPKGVSYQELAGYLINK